MKFTSMSKILFSASTSTNFSLGKGKIGIFTMNVISSFTAPMVILCLYERVICHIMSSNLFGGCCRGSSWERKGWVSGCATFDVRQLSAHYRREPIASHREIVSTAQNMSF